jgi:hypothetical protein
MSPELRKHARWKLILAVGLLGWMAGVMGCSTTKDDLQRSDVEQWYKEGKIDRVTYEDLMHKIDEREAAQSKPTTTQPPPPVAPSGGGEPAPPPIGQAPY